MIHLPALKGMEKYPFRFAIIAYYGFSFVIAWYWENFLDFFTRVLNQTRKLALVFWGSFLRFSAALHLHQRIFTWLGGILVCLCLAFLALKSSIQDLCFLLLIKARNNFKHFVFSYIIRANFPRGVCLFCNFVRNRIYVL